MAKQTRMINCVECKKEFLVEIPPHEVINSEIVSAAIMTHPPLYFCSHCGATYRFFIKTLKGVEYGWMPVQLAPEQAEGADKRLILPPSNFDPAKFS